MVKKDSSSPSPAGIIVREVGTIRNGVKKPFLEAGDDGITMRENVDAVRRRIRRTQDDISEIVINEEMTDILHGIDEYSHIIVLYWAHKVPESSRMLTQVRPMGRDEFPLMGIFSTCSPARPNPILMTVVRLHGKNKNTLSVSGLDAVDESPVIDIKPFVKNFYDKENIRIPEWMQRLCDEME